MTTAKTVETPVETSDVEPHLVHWHAGPAGKGCRGACGYIFPPTARDDVYRSACPACLTVLLDTPPSCPGPCDH